MLWCVVSADLVVVCWQFANRLWSGILYIQDLNAPLPLPIPRRWHYVLSPAPGAARETRRGRGAT